MRITMVIVIGLGLAACGPGSSGDDGETSVGTDPTVTTSTAETGAPSCEQYEPPAVIGPAVAVAVLHQGTTPVFFDPHGCGGALAFTIRDAAGDPVPYLLDSECFPDTCDGFVGAMDCSVGCNDCAPPNVGRIEAGAMGEGQWPGRRVETLALTEACAPALDCPDTCVRPDQAPAGTYAIELTVWRTCTGTCECDLPPGVGVCGVWGEAQLDDPVTFTAMIDYPAQTTVELVITD